ncbi:unnamed protein product [Amoebophrya sp. A120]|nr:unnamed protein product [Amoebophrya sp. A120]|eukprot:GSA120T00010604001.1
MSPPSNRNSEMMGRLAEKAVETMEAFDLAQLGSLSWSFSQYFTTTSSTASKAVGTATSRASSRIATPPASVKQFFQKTKLRLERDIAQTSPKVLVQFVYALSKMGEAEEDLYKFTLAPAIRSFLLDFETKDLCAVVWGFAHARIVDTAFLQDVAHFLEQKVSHMNAHDIAALVLAFSSFDSEVMAASTSLTGTTKMMMKANEDPGAAPAMTSGTTTTLEQAMLFRTLMKKLSKQAFLLAPTFSPMQLTRVLCGLSATCTAGGGTAASRLSDHVDSGADHHERDELTNEHSRTATAAANNGIIKKTTSSVPARNANATHRRTFDRLLVEVREKRHLLYRSNVIDILQAVTLNLEYYPREHLPWLLEASSGSLDKLPVDDAIVLLEILADVLTNGTGVFLVNSEQEESARRRGEHLLATSGPSAREEDRELYSAFSSTLQTHDLLDMIHGLCDRVLLSIKAAPKSPWRTDCDKVAKVLGSCRRIQQSRFGGRSLANVDDFLLETCILRPLPFTLLEDSSTEDGSNLFLELLQEFCAFGLQTRQNYLIRATCHRRPQILQALQQRLDAYFHSVTSGFHRKYNTRNAVELVKIFASLGIDSKHGRWLIDECLFLDSDIQAMVAFGNRYFSSAARSGRSTQKNSEGLGVAPSTSSLQDEEVIQLIWSLSELNWNPTLARGLLKYITGKRRLLPEDDGIHLYFKDELSSTPQVGSDVDRHLHADGATRTSAEKFLPGENQDLADVEPPEPVSQEANLKLAFSLALQLVPELVGDKTGIVPLKLVEEIMRGGEVDLFDPNVAAQRDPVSFAAANKKIPKDSWMHLAQTAFAEIEEKDFTHYREIILSGGRNEGSTTKMKDEETSAPVASGETTTKSFYGDQDVDHSSVVRTSCSSTDSTRRKQATERRVANLQQYVTNIKHDFFRSDLYPAKDRSQSLASLNKANTNRKRKNTNSPPSVNDSLTANRQAMRIKEYPYDIWLSDALVSLKIPHVKNFVVDNLHKVCIAFPEYKTLVDCLDARDLLCTTGLNTTDLRVTGSAILRRRQLIDRGWVVLETDLRMLHTKMREKCIRSYVSELVGDLAPLKVHKFTGQDQMAAEVLGEEFF